MFLNTKSEGNTQIVVFQRNRFESIFVVYIFVCSVCLTQFVRNGSFKHEVEHSENERAIHY